MMQNRKYATDPRAATLNPIQVLTENGYRIIRLSDIDESISDGGIEHRFIVRDPDGYELDVTVTLDARTAAELVRRSEGRITFESSFWINSAERHLAEYLWEHNDFPPGASIIVDQPTIEDLDLARRWNCEEE